MTRTTAKPAAHYHYLAETLRDLEADLRRGMEGSAFIPADWHGVAQGVPEPAKVKLTLRVDEDVARFFRTLGAGHLTRMNAVLRAFMHARLAGVVKGPEAVDYALTPMERYLEDSLAIIQDLKKRNERYAAGMNTGAKDLIMERRMRALEALADKAEVPQEDRLRM